MKWRPLAEGGRVTATLDELSKLMLDEVRRDVGRSKSTPRRLVQELRQFVNEKVATYPEDSARKLWDERLPVAKPDDDDRPSIYRDGDKLVQMDDQTGRERTIGFSTFRRYVTKARRRPRRE